MSSLSYLPNRTFWPRELHDYTPYIVANISVLGRLTGIDLVHLPFARRKIGKRAISDIVAVNAFDGATVILELQVEPANEDHWNRIVQHYAPNHNARAVIWIAESFSPTHLAVLAAHNRRPDAPFRVFAIACRVPVILPLAPYFEVVVWPREEKGNAAAISNVATCAGELPPYADLWARLLIQHPNEVRLSHQRASQFRIRRKRIAGWRVNWEVFSDQARVWLCPRKWWAVGPHLDLQPYAGVIEARLGVSFRCEKTGLVALMRRAISAEDTKDWRAVVKWMHERANALEAVLHEVKDLGGAAEPCTHHPPELQRPGPLRS